MAVTVDGDFARFGAKSYAIDKINSVEVRERRPHGIAAPLILSIVAIAFLVNGSGSNNGGGGTSVGIALVIGALAAWLWYRSTIREYLLFLMTSSSETQAFDS
jgi:hypothetical protein